MTATIPLDSQGCSDPPAVTAVEGLNSATDQERAGTQFQVVGGGPNIPDSQVGCDTHAASAVGDPTAGQANDLAPSNPGPLAALQLADPLLALAADVLDDLERVRIANENRLRQLTRGEDEVDADGRNDRGFGLTLDHPDVARLAALVEALARAEHDAELQLKRTLRRHPLGPWVKQARGVGEKQAARLLAAVGDPYWNDLHDRPRTVSELWAYCGYHVLPAGHRGTTAHTESASGAQLRTGHPAPHIQAGHAGSAQPPAGHAALAAQAEDASGIGGNPDRKLDDAHAVLVGVAAHRARGQKANWSATAKMRAYLVAVSIVKAGGPYREVYDQARAKYETAVHQVECKRCGPSGKPAAAGSPLSAGHQHARALRLVAKEVLKDLWREAKRLHELHDGHRFLGAQSADAVVEPPPDLHDGQHPVTTQIRCAVVGPTSVKDAS